MGEQTWKNLIDTLDVSDRWSWNPFKKEVVCFWWKTLDEDGTLYKAKAWVRRVSLNDFTKIVGKYSKNYRPLWFTDEWQFETGCCLEED